MLQKSTIVFLKSLKKNNNKPWFDEHRKDYEQSKKDMEQLVQSVIDEHGKNDPLIAGMKAKECMFRINRDVRFSNDKSPYKTNFGASINSGGKKSGKAGYYIHIEPGQSFTGGGLYVPMPPALKKVRQEIDYNLDEFTKIIQSKKFKSVYGSLSEWEGVKISRVPQGFDKESSAAPYLLFKSYIADKPLTDAELVDKKLLKIILDSFETLQPLLHFLNRALED